MSVQAIGGYSPQINWWQLTATQIQKYKTEGVEVPDKFAQWAESIAEQDKDSVTYEMQVAPVTQEEEDSGISEGTEGYIVQAPKDNSDVEGVSDSEEVATAPDAETAKEISAKQEVKQVEEKEASETSKNDRQTTVNESLSMYGGGSSSNLNTLDGQIDAIMGQIDAVNAQFMKIAPTDNFSSSIAELENLKKSIGLAGQKILNQATQFTTSTGNDLGSSSAYNTVDFNKPTPVVNEPKDLDDNEAPKDLLTGKTDEETKEDKMSKPKVDKSIPVIGEVKDEKEDLLIKEPENKETLDGKEPESDKDVSTAQNDGSSSKYNTDFNAILKRKIRQGQNVDNPILEQ